MARSTTLAVASFLQLLTLSLTISSENSSVKNWDRHLELKDGVFDVFWNSEPDKITFELRVKLLGDKNECNIGFGFTRSRNNLNRTDVYVAWIGNDGKINFQNRYSIEAFKFVLNDNQNHHELLASYNNGTHLIIRFNRKLNTCDAKNYAISDGTTRLISWCSYSHPIFVNDILLLSNGSLEISKTSVYLLDKQLGKINENTKDLIKWDVRMRNVSVPNKETTYWCAVFELPKIQTKHHFIGFEALIQPDNKMIVHHFLIFECDIPKTLAEENLKKTGDQCDSINVMLLRTKCKPPIVAWTIGSQGNVYPPDIGFPTEPTVNRSTYFVFEIHYNNLELRGDIIDQSGVRMYFTSDLRPKEAGMTQFGANKGYGMIIPPGQPSFRFVSVCPADCLKATIPAGGIYIFAIGIHTHLIGTKGIMRHFRDGKELDPIIIDNSFDFMFQELHHIPNPVHVLPTDILISECFYDSSKRNRSTISDLPATQEMCLIYPFYYPPSDLEACYTGVPTQIMRRIFNLTDNQWNSIFTKSPENYIKEFDWTSSDPSLAKTLQALQEYGTQDVMCGPTSYTHSNTPMWLSTDFAKNLKPYFNLKSGECSKNISKSDIVRRIM